MKTPLQKTQNDLRIARNTLWEHGYGDAGQVLHDILARSYEYQLDEVADNLDRLNHKLGG